MKALSDKNNLTFGFYISLFGTVLILLWVGLFKFTNIEANAIQNLVENHPLTFWMYDVFSVQTVSNLVGIFEIVVALLLIWGLKDIRVARIAAIGLLIIFGTTLSYLFTTPGINRTVSGEPFITNFFITDFFILKDIMYLGFAVTLLQLANKK
ncbi:YkgB family protein [Flavobacterium agricola]|uniref:YkgB family protein n=1 Tax=Flavobacterium agricola TaxID=2870839 RepID=A0ABY6LXJ6_9FLAO|nr:YkgB family protein [Flavobacterium agricola]UYW00959.1 YkgB family protein [Flavobacterium agricola]